MKTKIALDIGIWVTGIMSLSLILGALFFESYYKQIDIQYKYQGKGRKFLDWIAIFIDKNINSLYGLIVYILWAVMLIYIGYQTLVGIWLVSMILSYILVGTLKYISKKERPSDAKFTLEDFSFPSGHTTLGTTGLLNLAIFLSVFVPGYIGTIILFFLAFVGASIIGRSRWYLKVHWISDVLVGFLLGCFCFLIACSLTIHQFPQITQFLG